MKKTIVTVCGAMAAMAAFAKVEMGAPFADGMVLQRGVKAPVWGRATPGNEITVAFAGQELKTTVGVDGAWRVDFAPLAACAEDRVLTVVEAEAGWFGATVDEVSVKDVLVGEVWFASGQSNMECPVWGGSSRYRDANGAMVCAMANQPKVRLVKTPLKWSVKKEPLKAKWFKMTTADLKANRFYFSAAGYYFARELYLALGVPVGVIDASWGGTNIDAWTPPAAYENCDPSLVCVGSLPLFADKAQFVASLKDGAYAKYPGAKIYGTAENPRIVQQPSVIWNAMVADYAPFAIKGFVWYQGCHNGGEPQLYCAKMHALYDGWAAAFENPALKLYFVQLAPFSHNWLGICDAQNQFVAEEPNAAIAVVADHGNFDDIHPRDKEIVGQRLAVHALKRDYGIAVDEDDSPVFAGVTFAGDVARVSFSHVKNWYVYNQDRSRRAPFQLAGADGKWADAEIVNWRMRDGKDPKTGAARKEPTDFVDGPVLELRAKGVEKPVKVRYMGERRTAGTMYNEASLPLGPFESK